MIASGYTVPPVEDRVRIVQEAHAAGHYSVKVIATRIMEDLRLWWPTLHGDIVKEVSHCVECQRYNVVRRGYHPMRSPDATLPGDVWEVDLVDFKVTSQSGFSYVMCVLDLFTSYLVTRALRTRGAEEVAAALYSVITDWGPPRMLIFDLGGEVNNAIMKSLADDFLIKVHYSSPETHRSTTGVERVNRTLEESLRKLIGGAMAMWDVRLPLAQLCYNTTVRRVSKSNPYSLMFTRAWNLPGTPSNAVVSDDDIQEWCDKHQKNVLEQIYPAIREVRKRSREENAKSYNKKRHIVPSLKIGDTVMIVNATDKSKNAPKYLGNFEIIAISPTGSYSIRNEFGHVFQRDRSLLKPIPKPLAPQGKVYEVERVLKHRNTRGQDQYFVSWVGYPASENQWITRDMFTNEKAIKAFWSARQGTRTTAKEVRRQQSARSQTPNKAQRKRARS